MSDMTRILITADLNQGLSIGAINKAIKSIEKSSSLKAIRLKVDVDQSILNTLKEFNRSLSTVNQSMGKQSHVTNQVADASRKTTNAINKETQAIKNQNAAIIKNLESRKKIIDQETGKPKEIIDTYGNSQNNNKQRVRYAEDGKTVIGDIVETSNPKKDLQDRLKEEKRIDAERIKNDNETRKIRKAIADQNIADEKRRYDEFVRIKKQEFKLLQEEQKYARMQQDSLNKLAISQQKFGHHKAVRESLSGMESQIKSISAANEDWENSFKNINTQIAKSTAGFRALRQESINMGEALKQAFSKFPIWLVASTAIFAPLHGMQAAVDTILQVDKQITELKRVMDQDTNFDNLLQGSIDLSKELGRSITEVNEALTGFARQGFNESQILELTRTATLAQNISELKADEAMDALTAAMVVFNIEAKDSIGIIDSLNEVDNNMAVTSRDLALALQKSGSAAKTFGVSMHELIGDSAAILEITRETGPVVGNSLKTIYSRLTTMQPAIDSLASIGVNIHDSNDQLKTATQILDEVAVAFQNVNDETKQNVAVTVAGRYQLSRFLALVNNRAVAHEATAYALNSENSAMRENAAYMESFEARINKLKAAWQEFSLTMGDAVVNDSIIAITNSLTGMASVFGGVVDKVGILPPLFGLLATSVALMSKNFRVATISVITLGKGMDSLGVSSKRAGVALRSLGSATVVGAAFVALGFILDGLISKWAEHTEAVNKNREAQEKSIDSLRTNNEEVKKLLSEYNYLSEKTNLNTSENKRLLEVQNNLNELMPSLTHHIDAQGQAHLRNADNIKIELEHLDRLQKRQDEIRYRDRDKNRNSIFTDINREKDDLEDIETRQNLSDSFLGNFASQRAKDDISFDLEDQNYKIEQSYQKLTDELYKNAEASLRLKHSYENLTNEDKRHLQNLASKEIEVIKSIENTKEQKKAYDDASRSIESQAIKIAELRNQLGNAGSSLSVSELLALDSDQVNAISAINKEVEEGSKAWEDHKQTLLDNNVASAMTNSIITNLTNSLLKSTGASEEFADGIDDVATANKSFEEVTGDAITEVYSLYDAFNDLSKGEQLSLDTILGLINKYPELTNHLITENGQLSLNKQGVELLAKAKEAEFKSSIQQKKIEAEDTQKLLVAKLAAYGVEVSALEKLDKAKALSNANSIGEAQYLEGKFNEYAALAEQIKGLGALANINFSSGTPSSSKSSSSAAKDAAKLKDATDARINAINALADAQKELNDVTEETVTQDKTYDKQIELSQKLIDGKVKEINLLIDANKKLSVEQQKVNDTSKYDMSTWVDENGEATQSFIKLFNSMKTGSAQDSLQNAFDQFQKYNDAIKENEQHIKDLVKGNKELEASINSLREDRTVNWLDNNTKAYEKFNDALTESERKQMKYFEEESPEWMKEQEKQIAIRKEYQEALNKDNDVYRARIAASKSGRKEDALTTQQLEDLNAQIKENSDTWWNLEEAIVGTTKSLQKIRTEELKKQYEELRDKELDYIDEIMDAEEKRHDKRMDDLDDEMDKYQDAIDMVKKSMQRENAEEDFNKELAKLQKEELEIRSKISELALDDSIEAKYKREELEKELADKLEDIDELRTDRSRQLRENNLDDLLDKKEKEVEAAKKAEEAEYNANKEKLEKMKIDITTFWETILADENTYLQSQSNIINQHLSQVEGSLRSFFASASSISQAIGGSLSSGIADIANGYLGSGSSGVIGSIGTSPNASSQKSKDWQEYLNNKRRAEAVGNQSAEFYRLKAKNDAFRSKWGFQDGSYDQLKNLKVFDTGGYTGNSEGLAWLDKKEIVLKDTDTSNLLKIVSVVDGIMNRFNMSNLNSMVTGRNSENTNTPTVLQFDKMINVEKMEKGADIDTLMNQLDRRMRQWGFVIKAY